jgi:hypothetical protein
MKLLMENWRKFVAETERTKNYGDLYLFENDSIQKVSFYDRFSTLNESDDDFKLFLEQWEKSIDYIFNNLSEQEESNDAILRASTQAYMLLQRGGEAVGKVMNFAKKLKDKGTLGKVGDVVLLGLVAAAGAVTINSLVAAGADPAEFQQAVSQVADATSAIDPSVGQALEQIAQNPEAALEVMPQLDQAIEQSTQQLNQVDNEAVRQMAQEAEKVSQQLPEMDEFAQMFEDRMAQDVEAAQQAGETGVEQSVEQGADLDYSVEDFQQKGWQKKVEGIGNKLFGPGSKYEQKWSKAWETIKTMPGDDYPNREEFKEFTKALEDQGVDRKSRRAVKRIWQAGRFSELVDQIEPDLEAWPFEKMPGAPPPDFG